MRRVKISENDSVDEEGGIVIVCTPWRKLIKVKHDSFEKGFLHAVHQALDPFSTTRTNKNYRSDPAVVGKKKKTTGQ